MGCDKRNFRNRISNQRLFGLYRNDLTTMLPRVPYAETNVGEFLQGLCLISHENCSQFFMSTVNGE
jgi:hypothetical protein